MQCCLLNAFLPHKNLTRSTVTFHLFSTAKPKAILVWSLRCLTFSTTITLPEISIYQQCCQTQFDCATAVSLAISYICTFAMMVFMAGNWQAQTTPLNVGKWKLTNSGVADMRSKRYKDRRPKNTLHTLRVFTVQIPYTEFYWRTEIPLIFVSQPVKTFDVDSVAPINWNV